MNNYNTKFKVGQSVYVYTKHGLELKVIHEIVIRIEVDYTYISYRIDSSYEYYNEKDIISDYVSAKKKIQENEAQLQLQLS